MTLSREYEHERSGSGRNNRRLSIGGGMVVSVLLQADASTIASGVNNVWVLVVTFLIFFMQPGFALLEAGQVRAKNVGNVLMKNMNDWILGTLTYFVVGAGVATIVGGLTSSGSS